MDANTFFGFDVSVTEAMVGHKRAVRVGNILYVSPAMWSLMDGASGDELDHLFEHLGVMDFGDEITADQISFIKDE